MWPWACRGNAWLVLRGGPTPGLFQGGWACGPQRSKCVAACCARRSRSPFACLPATGFPLCAAFACPERPQLRWQGGGRGRSGWCKCSWRHSPRQQSMVTISENARTWSRQQVVCFVSSESHAGPQTGGMDPVGFCRNR